MVILAAGMGARMGRVKQLLPWRGQPVLAHVIDAALASSAGEAVVVVGYAADRVRREVGDRGGRVRYVVNPDYCEGMATSLAAGLNALDASAAAAVVLLGDAPDVTTDAIDAVAAAFFAGGVVAARAVYCHAGGRTPGHPVVIGRTLWDEVRALRGDVGARVVLAGHAAQVAEVELHQPPPVDLDLPADYEQTAPG